MLVEASINRSIDFSYFPPPFFLFSFEQTIARRRMGPGV